MEKIRVGIVGVRPPYSWSSIAHIPALRALPDYEITAVSSSTLASAEAAAAHFGIPKAFANHEELANSPVVDLVVITVKVPHHFELASAAIRARKHVLCEWPLGNGLAEAEQLTAMARDQNVKAFVGLQGRATPAINYLRDLVREGHIGDVLSSSLIGAGMGWGGHIYEGSTYLADRANGATMMTIPMGHTMDSVCYALGEVQELSAIMANRITEAMIIETGETIAKTAEDEIALIARLEDGIVHSTHYHGGPPAGPGLSWIIHGTKGELRVTGDSGLSQMSDLVITAGMIGEAGPTPLPVPASYYRTPVREHPALGVAEIYGQIARDLRDKTSTCPTFEDAVVRHRMIAAIEESAASGQWVAPQA